MLSGVRLLSLALNVPGPVAVARLVAEGAEAVKVEQRLYAVLNLAPDAPIGPAVATRTCAEWSALATAHHLPLAAVIPRR